MDKIKRARILRKEAPSVEKLLWRMLKAKRFLGLKFRRQHPMGNYFLDFYCPKLKIAIELDGETHDSEKKQKYDKKRDAWLKVEGVKVIRIPNDEVKFNLEGVMEFIKDTIKETTLSPNPHKR